MEKSLATGARLTDRRHFLAACNVIRLIAKGGAFRGRQPIRSASSTMIPSGPRT